MKRRRNELMAAVNRILEDGNKRGFLELYRLVCQMTSSKPSFTTVKSVLDRMPNLGVEYIKGRGLPKKAYYLRPNPVADRITRIQKRIWSKLKFERTTKGGQTLETLGKIGTQREELLAFLITDAIVHSLNGDPSVPVKSKGAWDIKGTYSNISEAEARREIFKQIICEAHEYLKLKYGLEVPEERIKQELNRLLDEEFVFFGNKNLYGFMYSKSFSKSLERLNNEVKERYATSLPAVYLALYDDLPEEFREEEIIWESG